MQPLGQSCTGYNPGSFLASSNKVGEQPTIENEATFNQHVLAEYLKLADQGNSAAQMELGRIYWEGRPGVERNIVFGIMFLSLAKEGGSLEAKDYLDEITRLTTGIKPNNPADFASPQWVPVRIPTRELNTIAIEKPNCNEEFIAVTNPLKQLSNDVKVTTSNFFKSLFDINSIGLVNFNSPLVANLMGSVGGLVLAGLQTEKIKINAVGLVVLANLLDQEADCVLEANSSNRPSDRYADSESYRSHQTNSDVRNCLKTIESSIQYCQNDRPLIIMGVGIHSLLSNDKEIHYTICDKLAKVGAVFLATHEEFLSYRFKSDTVYPEERGAYSKDYKMTSDTQHRAKWGQREQNLFKGAHYEKSINTLFIPQGLAFSKSGQDLITLFDVCDGKSATKENMQNFPSKKDQFDMADFVTKTNNKIEDYIKNDTKSYFTANGRGVTMQDVAGKLGIRIIHSMGDSTTDYLGQAICLSTQKRKSNVEHQKMVRSVVAIKIGQ